MGLTTVQRYRAVCDNNNFATSYSGLGGGICSSAVLVYNRAEFKRHNLRTLPVVRRLYGQWLK